MWLVSQPYILTVTVGSQHQDDFGHTNNIAYLQWLEKVAWAHSNHLGLDIDAYKRLNCGCVVRKHELNYAFPTYIGDELQVLAVLAGLAVNGAHAAPADKARIGCPSPPPRSRRTRR